MEWRLSMRWRALGDPVSEGRRVWEWIQRARPLHPSLDLWRPTADSPQEAEQAPPITQDYLLQEIHQTQIDWESESFGVAPAFSGQINQGSKLELYFNMPNPGDASIGLAISEVLGAALDASEAFADTLMYTPASIFAPSCTQPRNYSAPTSLEDCQETITPPGTSTAKAQPRSTTATAGRCSSPPTHPTTNAPPS